MSRRHFNFPVFSLILALLACFASGTPALSQGFAEGGVDPAEIAEMTASARQVPLTEDMVDRLIASFADMRKTGAEFPGTQLPNKPPAPGSRALKIGANGYILKDTSGEEIVKAFERIREGAPYLSHELASEVAFIEARGRTTNPLRSLTVRELQILSLLAEGRPYGEIASNLNVSYKTIANTCSQPKTKLGVHSLPELMRIAIEHLPSVPSKTLKAQ